MDCSTLRHIRYEATGEARFRFRCRRRSLAKKTLATKSKREDRGVAAKESTASKSNSDLRNG